MKSVYNSQQLRLNQETMDKYLAQFLKKPEHDTIRITDAYGIDVIVSPFMPDGYAMFIHKGDIKVFKFTSDKNES